MAIFNSYVSLPEGKCIMGPWWSMMVHDGPWWSMFLWTIRRPWRREPAVGSWEKRSSLDGHSQDSRPSFIMFHPLFKQYPYRSNQFLLQCIEISKLKKGSYNWFLIHEIQVFWSIYVWNLFQQPVSGLWPDNRPCFTIRSSQLGIIGIPAMNISETNQVLPIAPTAPNISVQIFAFDVEIGCARTWAGNSSSTYESATTINNKTQTGRWLISPDALIYVMPMQMSRYIYMCMYIQMFF
jgi:hypothetical protein